jgi:hypothetical protein
MYMYLDVAKWSCCSGCALSMALDLQRVVVYALQGTSCAARLALTHRVTHVCMTKRNALGVLAGAHF